MGLCTDQRATHMEPLCTTEKGIPSSRQRQPVSTQGWMADSGPKWMCLWQEGAQGGMEKATKAGPWVGLDWATCHCLPPSPDPKLHGGMLLCIE